MKGFDPLRHLPESNPFTYIERLLMVSAAAEAAGAGLVTVIPFPVTEPELWDDYVPPGAVQYLRLFSPWGAAKLERFRARGYRTELLAAPGGKRVSGAEVREAMRDRGGFVLAISMRWTWKSEGNANRWIWVTAGNSG